METRKGRLIPNLKPLDFFYKSGSRSPFEGELTYDSEDNVGFWSKNQNNVWEHHAASSNIQVELDAYGETGDNTFQNAQAFYESNNIHRFFFNQNKQILWLDNSIDISKFAYYAILEIKTDDGINKYVTGLVDSDGSDYNKALIPTSRKYGVLTKDIKLNTWYTVEFYNEKKVNVYSVNYLAYQSFTMPIDLVGESEDKTNTVTNVNLTFNQVKNGKGLLYKDHPLSELKPKLVLTMADRHQVEITDVSKMNLKGFDVIDSSKEGEYLVRAEYDIFGNGDSASSVIFKTYKENVLYLHTQSEHVPVSITVPKSNSTLYNRSYKEVRVRGIGNDNFVSVLDYQLTTDNDGNDVITIPYTYFKIEKNLVVVTYTEQTDEHVVNSKSLHIHAEAKVVVEEKPIFTYKKLYVAGYVDNDNGVNVVKYKFFILTNEDYIADITDDVVITYPDNYESSVVNRLVASFYGRNEIFFSYFGDINLAGATKRVLTSLNQMDLLTNPDTTMRPVLLCSTLQDESLRTGIGSFTRSEEASFADFATFISNQSVDFMTIKLIKPNTRLISDYCENTPLSIVPYYKEFKRLYNRYAITVGEEGEKYTTQPNYVKTYRLVKYKNVTVSNKPSEEGEIVSDKTLKEILQMMDPPVSDFGTFIGYSLNNVYTLTPEEEDIVIKAGTSKHIFAFYALDVNDDYEIPKNFPGHLEITYTLSRNSIRLNKDDPLLVEGYTKTSDGKYKCLGAVVCHAAIR